jgi:hypothetical protein
MVRREHHPDARQHRVELVVREGKCLGVGLAPVEPGALPRRDCATLLQKPGTQVARDDRRPRLRGRDSRIAGPRCHVEHAVTGTHAGRRHQRRPQRSHQFVGDGLVVAERPQRPVLGLQFEVSYNALFDGTHRHSSRVCAVIVAWRMWAI